MGVFVMSTNKYLEENSFEKSVSFRRQHLNDVKTYVKKVYNPMYFNTKPKYQKPMSFEEVLELRQAVKAVYNPRIMPKYDVFRELGIQRLADT